MYKASEIVNYAKSLADLQNSQFITWGDSIRMLNIAYKRVYQDMINNGDLTYLKEVALTGARNALYELPEDFYQLAMISDTTGIEIPKLPLSRSDSDFGYEIKNGTLYLQGVKSNTIVMKYYPTPDMITYKKERTANIAITNGVRSAYGTRILTSANTIYDLGTSQYIPGIVYGSTTDLTVLGRDAVYSAGMMYYLGSASAVDSLSSPMLTSSGDFVSNTYDNIPNSYRFGWCNDDKTARFVINSNGSIYFNGEFIRGDVTFNLTSPQGRVIWWNGKWALVTTGWIVYENGDAETTDVSSIALIKADTETGYGYVVRAGSSSQTTQPQFAIEGWAPDTIVDFPDNILFELVAYDLAIQYRMKQNSDSSALQAAYASKEQTYWKSLPQDQENFVTIRNVNKRYSRWRLY